MDVLFRRAGSAALHLVRRHGVITHNAAVWRHRMSVATLAARRWKSSRPVKFSQEDLRKRLTPLQYSVTQERGTERSDKKFDSGSGWPSFSGVIDEECVTLTEDRSHAMLRTEACCSQCGSHLGHLFEDGPLPTGRRYCVNSASLDFRPKEGAPPGTSGKSPGAS